MTRLEILEDRKAFLLSLDYISGYELKDLVRGYTTLEVLLDAEDLEKYRELFLK